MNRSSLNRLWIVPIVLAMTGSSVSADAKVGDKLERKGDEIVACGQFFHTGTPVVLWMDPGGYDAYRVDPRFAAADAPKTEVTRDGKPRTPNRYSLRKVSLTPEQTEQVRGGGWDLPLLQSVVDQFVIHFDACGTSRRCFEVLQDERHLSVQFMIDLDGTVYQTLDAKEGAWHATKSNGRSVGVEIANIGTFSPDRAGRSAEWYVKDADGHTRIKVIDSLGLSGLKDPSATLRPIRDDPITGTVQGQELRQYDLTPQQYEALTKLTATLCTIFPKIRCDYPRATSGGPIPQALSEEDWTRYQGVLGHYHVQTNKVDPGPAFQWDRVIDGARKLMAK
jgi:N-acetylmuramoyl-L-alanine amidase